MNKRDIFVGSVTIAVVQLLDIIIHVATNQAEILRITSNIIILLWLGSVISGKFDENSRSFMLFAVGIYLVLNVIFLWLEGVINPVSGEFRTILFIFVILTIGLSVSLNYIHAKSLQRP